MKNTQETELGCICPVCGKAWLEWFEFCEYCDWQNDRYQMYHPDAEGCANNMSLNQAKEAYAKGEPIH